MTAAVGTASGACRVRLGSGFGCSSSGRRRRGQGAGSSARAEWQRGESGVVLATPPGDGGWETVTTASIAEPSVAPDPIHAQTSTSMRTSTSRRRRRSRATAESFEDDVSYLFTNSNYSGSGDSSQDGDFTYSAGAAERETAATWQYRAFWHWGRWFHGVYFDQKTLGAGNIAGLLSASRRRGDGRDNEPLGYILASNHSSHLDCSAVFTSCWDIGLTKTYAFGARDYFFTNEGFRKWFVTNFMSLIPITRGKLKETELSMLEYILSHEGGEAESPTSEMPAAIVVFPEGTRSATGELQRFKTGVAYLSIRLGLPIVPVYTHGTHSALPKGRTFPLRREQVVVHFGKPLFPEDYLDSQHGGGASGLEGSGERNGGAGSNRESLQRLTEALRSAILDLKDGTMEYMETRDGNGSGDLASGGRGSHAEGQRWSLPILIFHIVTVVLRFMETCVLELLKALKKGISA